MVGVGILSMFFLLTRRFRVGACKLQALFHYFKCINYKKLCEEFFCKTLLLLTPPVPQDFFRAFCSFLLICIDANKKSEITLVISSGSFRLWCGVFSLNNLIQVIGNSRCNISRRSLHSNSS